MMAVDGPVLVAFAALAGSLVGACSSVGATFIGQRLQARWTRLGAELEEHEKLYGIFVEEAVHSICRRHSTISNRPREDYAALFKGGTYPPDIE